jgi:hypothetical protein
MKPLALCIMLLSGSVMFGADATAPAGKPPTSAAKPKLTKEQQIAEVKKERSAAATRVQAIVNQPVRKLKQTADMKVAMYDEGWFHEGATKPDFNTVDVRTTQETANYAKHAYVTSNLNPGVVFVGKELEFNSNTKFFYTDRTVPKKKLAEAEMVEINRLYRIIGKCEQRLEELESLPDEAPKPPAKPAAGK